MTQDPRWNRRQVLSLAGAGLATAGTTSSFGAGAPAGGIKPMKIGVFGLDYTFWTIWADLLSPKGKRVGTQLLRMQPVCVWDKNLAKAREFARTWDCEVVERFDGMIGKVDAIINGELTNVPWQHLLLRPYIQAGIPCFLQRHWSDSLIHLDDMLDLAARHSTPLMATVPFEHYGDADTAIAQLPTLGEVQGAFASAQSTDEPHFHIPHLMMKILGYDVEAVSMKVDDVRKVGYLAVDYVYPGNDRRRPFVLSMQGSGPDVFRFNIIGQQASVVAGMPAAADSFTRFFGQLLDIQRSFEKRALYQPLEVIRRKYQCLQAAWYSHLQRDGALVKVGSVPADWRLPAWNPGAYDASDFRT